MTVLNILDLNCCERLGAAGYVPPNKETVKRLMGVEHDVTWQGLYEGLPPAYTEWIIGRFTSFVHQKNLEFLRNPLATTPFKSALSCRLAVSG